jgi:hypothetical protein
MEKSKKDCAHEGVTYADGYEFCTFDRCLKCEEGSWKETSFDFVGP